MRASGGEFAQCDERAKEYQRQQERLKAMATSGEKIKPVSADAMIESLLKQNLTKPSGVARESRASNGLPGWLQCDSPMVPAVYKHLWSLVKATGNFADTQRVSQLLLTSGLQKKVLGFIWNLANKAVPGQLNKQEFFIVLALIGLVQSGYSFNDLYVLNLIQTAPIPHLQTRVLDKPIIAPATNVCFVGGNVYEDVAKSCARYGDCEVSLENVAEVKSTKKASRCNSKDLFEGKTSNFPLIGSSPTAELEDDGFSEFHSVSATEDEFTDFQSADFLADPLETVVVSSREKKEIPKIPLPRSLGAKISGARGSLLKISPESERKLKALSQSEALSTLPESKISSNNEVSTMPNISVIGGSRDIGMRLANHSLGSFATADDVPKTKHQRQKQRTQPLAVEDTFFSAKFGPIDELFPKCFQKSSSASGKTFVLKETKIRAPAEADPPPAVQNNTRRIEIPVLGTFNETTLPVRIETREESVELFTVEEDKYSALREVEMEMKQKRDAADDFGEFLSADIPAPDLWCEWTDPQQPPEVAAESREPVVSGLSFDLLTLDDATPPPPPPPRAEPPTTEDSATPATMPASDFGDFFFTADSLPSLDLSVSPAASGDRVQRCLATCVDLLRQGLDIFNSVSSKSVLDEVFSTQDAVDYLNCLYVIYCISRRVLANRGGGGGGDGSRTRDDVDRIWSELIRYCREYDVELKDDVDACERIGVRCGVCLGYVGSEAVDRGETSYHPSCANLWINCIDYVLPCTA